MKKFVFAVVILAALIGGGLAYQTTLLHFADDMAAYCRQMEQNLYEDADLETVYEACEQYWTAKEPALSCLVDHVHLNSLSMAMNELGMAIHSKQEVDILLSCAKVRTEARHLAENEALHFKNLL